MTKSLETDYLVVGCGASGLAFTDALISDSSADVVIVDRRHAPGGHWNDAYPFVRLHQPSAYYGVNSLPLGSETIDTHGSNKGFYERAGGREICVYYDRVMQQRLLPSGKVRYFPMCEYVGENRFRSLASGETFEVKVRKKHVDARYLEPSIPATFKPSFEVASGARCVPVNDLVRMREQTDGYVIIGAGKTAADACLWLLEIGVPPEDICWIKPREALYVNRAFAQGGELVGTLFEGFSMQVEAAAEARSVDDLMHRLKASGQLVDIDDEVVQTMYKAATTSVQEIEQLRRIRNVVRLGHVRRIESDSIVLEQGTVATSPRVLHVHCAAPGLKLAPSTPVFTDQRITLQPVRVGLIPFNAALVGFVEAHWPSTDDTANKNRLCPPNAMPDVPLDWLRGMLIAMQADYLWSKESAIVDWLERSRLNPTRGIRKRGSDPQVQRAGARYATYARPAVGNLQRLVSQAQTG